MTAHTGDIDPLWLQAKPQQGPFVRTPRCRKLDRNRNCCTSEEVGDSGLCTKHLIDAYQYVQEEMRKYRGKKTA